MNDSPPKRSCETLSPALLGSTVTVATLIAAGNPDIVGIFSTQASMLLKGALKAMLIAMHKFPVAVTQNSLADSQLSRCHQLIIRI